MDLCFTLTAFPTISAWDHTFTPREYIVNHIEDMFIRYTTVYVYTNSDTVQAHSYSVSVHGRLVKLIT